MSREKELAALETQICRAQARAQKLGLDLLSHLLTMAQIELTEAELRPAASVKIEL